MDLVTKQREERKQRILDVARDLIASRGYEGVTMRDLADESLVSVPTLYNLFGGKQELLFAAVESYFLELLKGAEESGRDEGLPQLISLVEMIGREMLQRAAYARSLMRFFGGRSETGGLHEFVAHRLTNELVMALKQMQSKRQLAGWVDPQVLGERLSSHFIITSFEWASDYLTDEGMQSGLLYGLGMMLLAVARGKAAEELEALVREHQATAAARQLAVPVPAIADV
jgi:AcrR family transcriptional regulator